MIEICREMRWTLAEYLSNPTWFNDWMAMAVSEYRKAHNPKQRK
jgi:hypothetical protein